MATRCIWLNHEFQICTYGGSWNPVPGLYIFCAVAGTGRWRALYVGQTDSFSESFRDHPVWPEAVRRGATHVHAFFSDDNVERFALEQALVYAFKPPLNESL